MLPVNVWYAAGGTPSDSPELVRIGRRVAGRRSMRRLVGHGLIRLGHAISRPARGARATLADGLAPR